jgi:CHAD domain-containing protein
MARARDVEGLRCEEPFALAAARVVEVRTEELLEHSSDVLDTADIEGVHDMRVASRRLRAAMEVFAPCFPRKPYKRVLSEVKAIADALGERRDRDVSIAALEQLGQGLTAGDRQGVAVLADRLREEQALANDRLVAYVELERLQRLRSEIGELTAAARERAR